jgi:sugar phosphate isomerase/epimerase
MHIKENLWLDGQPVTEPAAGMGDMHWGKVMAFLYEADFDGWLIVEPHGKTWESPRLRDKMLALTKKHLSQFLLD